MNTQDSLRRRVSHLFEDFITEWAQMPLVEKLDYMKVSTVDMNDVVKKGNTVIKADNFVCFYNDKSVFFCVKFPSNSKPTIIYQI